MTVFKEESISGSPLKFDSSKAVKPVFKENHTPFVTYKYNYLLQKLYYTPCTRLIILCDSDDNVLLTYRHELIYGTSCSVSNLIIVEDKIFLYTLYKLQIDVDYSLIVNEIDLFNPAAEKRSLCEDSETTYYAYSNVESRLSALILTEDCTEVSFNSICKLFGFSLENNFKKFFIK